MIINLSEIMSVKGQVKNIQAPFELKSVTYSGMECLVERSSQVDLTVSHTGERKVEIEGETEVDLLISCNRCLGAVKVPFKINFFEKLDFNLEDEDAVNKLKEINYVNEYDLDLDLLVQNAIILDFPMKVLCSNDCKGLCNSCGTNLNKDLCNCESTSLDPRMAAIQDIFNEFKEV